MRLWENCTCRFEIFVTTGFSVCFHENEVAGSMLNDVESLSLTDSVGERDDRVYFSLVFQ